MLEPFAAVVYNSLLSGRALNQIYSAASSMTRPLRHTMSPDFFTPQPRRWKGKEKATYGLPERCSPRCIAQCREWSCIMHYSLWMSRRGRILMMKELIPRRDRPSRRHSYLPGTTPRSSSARNRIFMTKTGLSNSRHSSHTSHDVERALPPHLIQNVLGQFNEFLQSSSISIPLEGALRMFEKVVGFSALHRPAINDLLRFAGMVLALAEKGYHQSSLDEVHQSGHRIRFCLEKLNDQITPLSPEDYQCLCYMARALSLVGDFQTAVALVRKADNMPLSYEEKGGILDVYTKLILSTRLHFDEARVLEFLLNEWDMLASHLLFEASKSHFAAPKEMGRNLRQIVYNVIANIENPDEYLANHQHLDQRLRQNMAVLLIEALCAKLYSMDAYFVLKEMEKQALLVTANLQLKVVRTLTRDDLFEPAKDLFVTVDPSTDYKYYLSTGLYLYAHQGNDMEAEDYYNRLAAQDSWITGPDNAMRLHVYATQGNAEKTTALFHELFTEGSGGQPPKFSAERIHYSIVIYGYAQNGDVTSMYNWLDKMVAAGFDPDAYVYNMILRCFALRGDMESIAKVLDQMREAGIQPGMVSYTTIIALLAHRRDPFSAEIIYKRAIADGVVPDRRMILAVMDAHVEAGSWQGVIRAFDYLKRSHLRHLRLTTAVYNTLFKAYVLIGAPFHVVSRLFRRLESAKVRPDKLTFTLLLQSACDAGLLDIAEEIFVEMDRLASSGQSAIEVDVYVMTVLMSAYFRRGQVANARRIYDEMLKRGIQPSAITLGTIMKSYTAKVVHEGKPMAEEFLNTLMSVDRSKRVWDKPTYGGKSALQHVYGPLLASYARNERPEDVERLFQEYIGQGGEPSLGVLASLMNTYRLTFNIKRVLEIWPQVLQLGIRYANVNALLEGSTQPNQPRLQSNVLCVPLSIYIDALSAAGLHDNIAEVWKEVQSHGFTFDSHNWNHLAVALVRAGEPERAFEVVERVLLPYHRQTKQMIQSRNSAPTSPLTLIEEFREDEVNLNRLQQAPMHSSKLRTRASKTAASSKMPAEGEQTDDFAHPLYVLHRVSPSWNVWEPHVATRSVLLMAFLRLQMGALVEPIMPAQVNKAEAKPDQVAQRDLAHGVLNRIYKDCPETVELIRKHEVLERRRLRSDYDQTYIWR